MGLVVVALFGLLAGAGCSHKSDPADRDRPAAPPADAIAKIQSSSMTPEQKQMAVNAVTVARTRANGQITLSSKKDAGL